MKLTPHLTCLVLLIGTMACHSTEPSPRATTANEALLLEVSAEDRSNIAAARKACDYATDAHAQAVADQTTAKQARALAAQAYDAALDRVERYQTALDQATQSGTIEAASSAGTDVQQAKAQAEIAAAKLTVSEKQVAYADALVSLAEQHIKVAMADLELVKVNSINTLDRPDAQKREVSEFEASLRRAEGEENVARTRAETAEKEIAVAVANLEERQRAGATP